MGSTGTTAISQAVAVGSTTIKLADVSWLSSGMPLTIAEGSKSETKQIVSVSVGRRLSENRRLAAGSVTVDSPLQNSFAAGATVTVQAASATQAPVEAGGSGSGAYTPWGTGASRLFSTDSKKSQAQGTAGTLMPALMMFGVIGFFLLLAGVGAAIRMKNKKRS